MTTKSEGKIKSFPKRRLLDELEIN